MVKTTKKERKYINSDFPEIPTKPTFFLYEIYKKRYENVFCRNMEKRNVIEYKKSNGKVERFVTKKKT